MMMTIHCHICDSYRHHHISHKWSTAGHRASIASVVQHLTIAVFDRYIFNSNGHLFSVPYMPYLNIVKKFKIYQEYFLVYHVLIKIVFIELHHKVTQLENHEYLISYQFSDSLFLIGKWS